MTRFGLLADQGTLKSLLQHHNSKASILLFSLLYYPSLTSLHVCVSHSVMSNSLQFHGLYPTRFLCPCNSPGKNTGVGCHSLLQGIFLTPWIQIKPGSPELQADSLSSEPPGKNMTAGTLTYIDFCWQSDIFIFQYTV